MEKSRGRVSLERIQEMLDEVISRQGVGMENGGVTDGVAAEGRGDAGQFAEAEGGTRGSAVGAEGGRFVGAGDGRFTRTRGEGLGASAGAAGGVSGAGDAGSQRDFAAGDAEEDLPLGRLPKRAAAVYERLQMGKQLAGDAGASAADGAQGTVNAVPLSAVFGALDGERGGDGSASAASAGASAGSFSEGFAEGAGAFDAGASSDGMSSFDGAGGARETLANDYPTPNGGTDLAPEKLAVIQQTEGAMRELLQGVGVAYDELIRMDGKSAYAQAVVAYPQILAHVKEAANPVMEAVRIALAFKPYADFTAKYGNTPEAVRAAIRAELEGEMAARGTAAVEAVGGDSAGGRDGGAVGEGGKSAPTVPPSERGVSKISAAPAGAVFSSPFAGAGERKQTGSASARRDLASLFRG